MHYDTDYGEEKVCPLMAIANQLGCPANTCERERCAWWDGEDERCALLTIARAQSTAAMVTGAV